VVQPCRAPTGCPPSVPMAIGTWLLAATCISDSAPTGPGCLVPPPPAAQIETSSNSLWQRRMPGAPPRSPPQRSPHCRAVLAQEPHLFAG